MKPFPIILNVLMVLVATMCGSTSMENTGEAILTAKKSDDTCLLGFIGDEKGRFFTEDLIKPLANGNEIKSDHSESYHLYRYNWKDDGVIRFIGFDDMKTQEDIRLVRNESNKKVGNLMVNYVENLYRDKTKDEIEKLNKLFDEQVEKSDDANAKSSSNEMLQSQVMSMEQNAYIPLQSSADYAVYNRKSFGLYVVIGEVLVTLSAQVGPYGSVDEAKSIELARQLANQMATVCK